MRDKIAGAPFVIWLVAAVIWAVLGFIYVGTGMKYYDLAQIFVKIGWALIGGLPFSISWAFLWYKKKEEDD